MILNDKDYVMCWGKRKTSQDDKNFTMTKQRFDIILYLKDNTDTDY